MKIRYLAILPLLLLASCGKVPLEKVLMDEARFAGDRERDAGRKPAEVVKAMGIKRGMTVMDMIAAGGYYTEVLSHAVGSRGQVYAQNPPFMLRLRDGAHEKTLSRRLAGDRLPNVSRINLDLAEIDLAPGSLDAVITALNFHDIYNRDGRDAALVASEKILSLLKPGGVFAVIDHEGRPQNDNRQLHRMPMGDAAEVLTAAGFRVTELDLLRNPDDSLNQRPFHPSVRGNTDRFLLLARKP